MERCARCESSKVKGSYTIRPGHIAYRVHCEECGLSTREVTGGDLFLAKEQAEHFWNCTLPRLRLRKLSHTLDEVIQRATENHPLDRQLKLF